MDDKTIQIILKAAGEIQHDPAAAKGLLRNLNAIIDHGREFAAQTAQLKADRATVEQERASLDEARQHLAERAAGLGRLPADLAVISDVLDGTARTSQVGSLVREVHSISEGMGTMYSQLNDRIGAVMATAASTSQVEAIHTSLEGLTGIFDRVQGINVNVRCLARMEQVGAVQTSLDALPIMHNDIHKVQRSVGEFVGIADNIRAVRSGLGALPTLVKGIEDVDGTARAINACMQGLARTDLVNRVLHSLEGIAAHIQDSSRSSDVQRLSEQVELMESGLQNLPERVSETGREGLQSISVDLRDVGQTVLAEGRKASVGASAIRTSIGDLHRAVSGLPTTSAVSALKADLLGALATVERIASSVLQSASTGEAVDKLQEDNRTLLARTNTINEGVSRIRRSVSGLAEMSTLVAHNNEMLREYGPFLNDFSDRVSEGGNRLVEQLRELGDKRVAVQAREDALRLSIEVLEQKLKTQADSLEAQRIAQVEKEAARLAESAELSKCILDLEQADLAKQLRIGELEQADLAKQLRIGELEQSDLANQMCISEYEQADLVKKMRIGELEQADLAKQMCISEYEQADIATQMRISELEAQAKSDSQRQEIFRLKTQNAAGAQQRRVTELRSALEVQTADNEDMQGQISKLEDQLSSSVAKRRHLAGKKTDLKRVGRSQRETIAELECSLRVSEGQRIAGDDQLVSRINLMEAEAAHTSETRQRLESDLAAARLNTNESPPSLESRLRPITPSSRKRPRCDVDDGDVDDCDVNTEASALSLAYSHMASVSKHLHTLEDQAGVWAMAAEIAPMVVVESDVRSIEHYRDQGPRGQWFCIESICLRKDVLNPVHLDDCQKHGHDCVAVRVEEQAGILRLGFKYS